MLHFENVKVGVKSEYAAKNSIISNIELTKKNKKYWERNIKKKITKNFDDFSDHEHIFASIYSNECDSDYDSDSDFDDPDFDDCSDYEGSGLFTILQKNMLNHNYLHYFKEQKSQFLEDSIILKNASKIIDEDSYVHVFKFHQIDSINVD